MSGCAPPARSFSCGMAGRSHETVGGANQEKWTCLLPRALYVLLPAMPRVSPSQSRKDE